MKYSIKSLLNIFILIFLFSCQNQAQNNTKQLAVQNANPVEVPLENGLGRAYFASGCFWCVEAVYESVNGVEEVINGYSGGHTNNPTYDASNTGRTGHAEAVEVIYNSNIVDFTTLVDVYFGSQNPSQINGQGPDRGSQYRSILFYQNDEQKQIILKKKRNLNQKFKHQNCCRSVSFSKILGCRRLPSKLRKTTPRKQIYTKCINT